MAKIKINK